MLGAWIDARQCYHDFWGMTPKEIILIVDGLRKRDQREHEEARIRNYELANLLTFAQHDPKKMPEYRPMKTTSAAKSDEAQQAQARGHFIAWALQHGAKG